MTKALTDASFPEAKNLRWSARLRRRLLARVERLRRVNRALPPLFAAYVLSVLLFILEPNYVVFAVLALLTSALIGGVALVAFATGVRTLILQRQASSIHRPPGLRIGPLLCLLLGPKAWERIFSQVALDAVEEWEKAEIKRDYRAARMVKVRLPFTIVLTLVAHVLSFLAGFVTNVGKLRPKD
jgi:hypothetical protein